MRCFFFLFSCFFSFLISSDFVHLPPEAGLKSKPLYERMAAATESTLGRTTQSLKNHTENALMARVEKAVAEARAAAAAARANNNDVSIDSSGDGRVATPAHVWLAGSFLLCDGRGVFF